MATTTFSMRMDENVRAALNEHAKLEERSASHIAERAIREWLNRQEAMRQELAATLAEADKGIWISSEAIDKWMDRWADGHDDPFPDPDVFIDGSASKAA